MGTKFCNTCKKEKSLDEFSKCKDNKDGKQSKCRECSNALSKKFFIENPGYRKKYLNENRKRINKYRLTYNSERDDGLYMKWMGILKRLNSKDDEYSYKSRGIKNEWKSYTDFKNDMQESFLEHLKIHGREQTSLDRIDNDGNYSRNNCRWANWIIQNNNKRPYRNLGNWGKRKGRKFPNPIKIVAS